MSCNLKLFIGTYTEPILFGTGELLNSKGKGIYAAELDVESGSLDVLSVTEGMKNPSYLTFSADRKYLYCVQELKTPEGSTGGLVSAYAIQDDLSLRHINTLETKGGDPCHVAVSPDGTTVVVTNFMSGSVSAYAVKKDGSLEGPVTFIQHEGNGPNKARQKGPHAHSTVFSKDGKYVYVPDLGIDQIVIYKCLGNGKLENYSSYVSYPGSGPRFCEMHPENNILYLINELGSSISSLAIKDDGTLEKLSDVSTLAVDYTGDNICADTHVSADGRFLYASNRGENTIAVFALDGNGNMRLIQRVSCGGKTPRNFTLAAGDRLLLCANQDTDNIVCFAVNNESGQLNQMKSVSVPTPVCVKMM